MNQNYRASFNLFLSFDHSFYIIVTMARTNGVQEKNALKGESFVRSKILNVQLSIAIAH